MLSKLDFVNNFHSHVSFHYVIVSTAVFRFVKKKKKIKWRLKKTKHIPLSQGSVVTAHVFDSGVLKESIISVYSPPNTYSDIFYRHTIVQFYDRFKNAKRTEKLKE